MSIKSLRQFALPGAAGLLLLFAVLSSLTPEQGRAAPLIAPPQSPFAGAVSGVGVVEPQSEMISVATEIPGVVREVMVAPGDRVEKGAPLFALDSRALRAALAEAEAARATADAAARTAAINVEDERQRLSLYQSIADKRAVSVDEIERRRFAVERARAGLAEAEAAIEAASARVEIIATDLERLTIAAPISGEIYSVDVRPGEFAAAGPLETPLMTIGASERLHLRVEIDESDIGRVAPTMPAVGVARGGGEPARLSFVRVEPRATPKRALAGGSERVDARVIEVLYAFDADVRAIVGQRFDVFIGEKPLAQPGEASS